VAEEPPMKIWDLNGRFNFVKREDAVRFFPPEETWTLTKKGNTLLTGKRGESVTLEFCDMAPGEVISIEDGNRGVTSTYCVKYPPEVIGDPTETELERTE
jgi:hypothetical protein